MSDEVFEVALLSLDSGLASPLTLSHAVVAAARRQQFQSSADHLSAIFTSCWPKLMTGLGQSARYSKACLPCSLFPV